MIEQLRKLEWSSFREGPGYGPMDSGPGKRYPACPECRGIDPAYPSQTDFGEKAKGHRADCSLAETLDASRSERAKAIREQKAVLERELAELEVEYALHQNACRRIGVRQQEIYRAQQELDQP